MKLNENIWLPHLKFILKTIALRYPSNPNEICKKKYYEFMHNLPVFININPMGKTFSKLLDKYPISPYLSSRESYLKWLHFIFNKINIKLGLPVDTYKNFMDNYYDEYKPIELKNKETYEIRKKYMKYTLIITFMFLIYYLYHK
tara:strand:- start:222 stop:653 length:432 start_codon:yes stop_codon:yes gene_type:complete